MQFLNLFPVVYKDVYTWVDLMYFALISLVLISVLLFYYSKLSRKSRSLENKISLPLYNSKDIFSQEIVGDSNFVITEKVTSIRSKLIVYGLVILFVTSSMARILDPISVYWFN